MRDETVGARACDCLSRVPRQPLTLPSGESRAFLADGDEVVERGYCARDGFVRIGFGEAAGVIRPAAGQR